VEAVDRLEEKDGSNSMIKIARFSTKEIEFIALLQQLVDLERLTELGQSLISGLVIFGGDN